MKIVYGVIGLITFASVSSILAGNSPGTVILDDHFDRHEQHPEKEQIGNDWTTNSRRRAHGVKQVDLDKGAMHITRAAVADHGVSVVHDVAFRDALIQLRFQLGAHDDLGIDIADMREKSVHAGHICRAGIRPGRVELVDLKTGRMNLKLRARRLAGTLTEDDKRRLRSTSKTFKFHLTPDKWHQLDLRIVGDLMVISIDGKKIGEFQSEGIGHATKSHLRLAVHKTAWVDDVKVVRLK